MQPRFGTRLRAWLILPCVLGIGSSSATAQDPFHHTLAARWAPVHHQDVDRTGGDGLGGRSDFLSRIDFDGDWNMKNNWENTPFRALRGAGYYSVVETVTHWFIVYAFFHPRDWTDNGLLKAFDTHENDLEGVLAVVRKPPILGPTTFGTLEAVITVFHKNFYSYVPIGSRFRAGRESIDGVLFFVNSAGANRFVVAQESKGHGLKAWPQVRIKGGDGVVYTPTRFFVNPPLHANDRNARYQLIDIFAPGGLWTRRHRAETFARWGVFVGDNGKDNMAKAPWGWDDHNDGSDLPGGELASDPAKIVSRYFSNLGPFSTVYLHNPYLRIIKRPGATVTLSHLTHVPRHTRGDRDFKGHGPRVNVETLLRVSSDRRRLEARVWMRAEEWERGGPKRDFTTADSTSSWRTVFFAPAGRTIDAILSSTRSSTSYIDNDHDVDEIPRAGTDLVQRYTFVGDTRGDEAGTRTRVTVTFNPVRLRLR